MTFRNATLLAVASGALLSLACTAPATAFTHHPATPEEMRQTEALNEQSLANARGAATNQVTAAMTPSAPAASMAATASPLKSLTAVPPALGSATVQSNSGSVVGSVQKVLTGSDGKPSMVNVALSSNQKIVAISADELNYDASRNILVATLSAEQIMSLPAASS
jgi:hypothetical protein